MVTIKFNKTEKEQFKTKKLKWKTKRSEYVSMVEKQIIDDTTDNTNKEVV